MRSLTLLAGLAGLALAGDAPPTTNQPSNVQYIAQLPNTNSLQGSVTVTGATSGQGVQISVSLSGLPSEGGPFLYHIHNSSLAQNGSCATASGHLDPYGNGGTGCDTTKPASCEVGDLSGKHGKAGSPGAFAASYEDFYVSVDNGPATVIGHSLVVHFANKTAITCANFTMGGAGSGGTGGSGGSGYGGSTSGGNGSGGGGPGGAGSPQGSNGNGNGGNSGNGSGQGSGGAPPNACG